MNKMKKVPGIYIDSQGRRMNIYREIPEPQEPFVDRHPLLVILGIIGYIISLPIAFALGVLVQATPRGVGKHWAHRNQQ